MKQMKEQIDRVKNMFEPVALRVSNLFFVLADLMTVDPMYQYSLDFFTTIYNRALKKADEKGIEKNERETRRAYYISKFTTLLYKNVCRSLFEKDKLLFSFLLCIKIMEERGELSNPEARFLMAGPTAVSAPRPNPTGEKGWLLDKQWAHICELAENYEFYKGFDRDLEENLGAWEKISVSVSPEADEWPGKWNEIPIFSKLLILRVLRPDKVVPGIRNLISAEVDLGSKYIKPPPFDLTKSYKDSTNKTPIIIVISAGADPMAELQKLAAKMKIKI
jgi:dynein heavy chain